MVIKGLADIILFDDKRTVLRLHLYTKLLQNKIKPYESDMDILIELYVFGGYNNTTEQASFIKSCLEKGYLRTAQSVRNTLSKYTNLKVLLKPRNGVISFSEDFIPTVAFDKLMLKHIISHN